jgi:hypothetical protein
VSTAAPSDSEITSSLAECSICSVLTHATVALEQLAFGLSGSGVWRVRIRGERSNGAPHSFILKIPDHRTQSDVFHVITPDLQNREREAAEAGLFEALEEVWIKTPRVRGIQKRAGKTWIWMEDLAGTFDFVQDDVGARHVARELSKLHVAFGARAEHWRRQSWLGRREFLRYRHWLPAARQNVERLRQEDGFGPLTPRDLGDLATALDELDWATGELEQLPQTLLHGDFQIRNLALNKADARLVLFDWAHVGIGPLGGDLASFISVYRFFGGSGGALGSGFDEALITEYAEALQSVGVRDICRSNLERVCGLWNMTWGLHLRLGAALSALNAGISDLALRAKIELDVVEGCQRALGFTRTRR